MVCLYRSFPCPEAQHVNANDMFINEYIIQELSYAMGASTPAIIFPLGIAHNLFMSANDYLVQWLSGGTVTWKKQMKLIMEEVITGWFTHVFSDIQY